MSNRKLFNNSFLKSYVFLIIKILYKSWWEITKELVRLSLWSIIRRSGFLRIWARAINKASLAFGRTSVGIGLCFWGLYGTIWRLCMSLSEDYRDKCHQGWSYLHICMRQIITLVVYLNHSRRLAGPDTWYLHFKI